MTAPAARARSGQGLGTWISKIEKPWARHAAGLKAAWRDSAAIAREQGVSRLTMLVEGRLWSALTPRYGCLYNNKPIFHRFFAAAGLRERISIT